MTAELDELKWKRGAGVWYTARDDEDDPPLKKNDGCRRVAPGAVVLMLTTVVGVCITDTRRPERVASGITYVLDRNSLAYSSRFYRGLPCDVDVDLKM